MLNSLNFLQITNLPSFIQFPQVCCYCYITYLISEIFYNFFQMKAEEGFYFIKNDDSSDFLLQKFQDLVGEHTARPQVAEVVMGRKLQVHVQG